MSSLLPRYPIYIPTKGRHQRARALTIRFLQADGVPFRVVVEPQEADAYAAIAGKSNILVLPFRDRGTSTPARNFIKDHATAEGHARHWQLDDNIRGIKRVYRGKRLPVRSGPAFAIVEDFTDRYTNIAISGMLYDGFGVHVTQPFVTNTHVYSCTLVNNAIPHRWRLQYNEDTDMCLQVLAAGWCTVSVRAFLACKIRTMTLQGGNTDGLYRGDGRLRMARMLERAWPGVVTVDRRYGRPQHVVNWSRFTTPLRLRDDIDIDALPRVDEHGLTLRAVAPVRSPVIRRLLG